MLEVKQSAGRLSRGFLNEDAAEPLGFLGMREAERLVRKFFHEIRKSGLKDEEIAERIRPLTRRQTYNGGNVSQWRRGPGMSPADALIAVALITRLSLDEILFEEEHHTLAERQREVERELGELKKLVETRPLLAGDEPRGELDLSALPELD